MKAFLLAAGLGTRLRPMTNRLPKCLVPIGSRPLLQIWLELLGHHDVTEVLINTHYLSEKVEEFAKNWSRTPKIQLSHEEVLLGSAGTLDNNWDFVAGEESFLVCYADNLTDVDLAGLIRFHQGHDGLVSMTLFHTERPGECGIAEIDENGLMLSFEEKPVAPQSNLASAGVFVMRKGIRPRLLQQRPSDISYHLLPRCAGEMYGWLWKGLLIDIGTPESYLKAQETWANRSRPSGLQTAAVSKSESASPSTPL